MILNTDELLRLLSGLELRAAAYASAKESAEIALQEKLAAELRRQCAIEQAREPIRT